MTSVTRRTYIDWARGVAVLLMIEAHALDAWTRLADRKTVLYRDATILGGFAAPLFLFLAGLAVVLSATRTAQRTGSRALATEAIVRRGLEIFILAFLFRIQAFIVSPGNHPVALFRVDILNIMGPAIAAAGLVWAVSAKRSWRVTAFALVATAFTMLTPIVRTAAFVDWLPVWAQWNIRPAGELTVFTFFPWAGFVFAGGAVGVLLAAAGTEKVERRLHAALALSGVALIELGFFMASRPSIYASSSFWTSSPTWFAIRVGILIVAVSAIYLLEMCLGRRDRAQTRESNRLFRAVALSWQAPLARMGRSSLFIYWIHVELVYGYASWLWRHRLPIWGTVIAYVVFCVLIYRAIAWRDRIVAAWRARPRAQVMSAAPTS
jgi:uncharacterized membrane protein